MATLTDVMSDPQFRTVVNALNSAGKDTPTALILGVEPGHRAVSGRWEVEIKDDGALHVSRLSNRGKTTVTPTRWRANQGAFIFVENDQQVWAYDGDRDLFLLTASGNTLTSHGPPTFPGPVPVEVRKRVSAQTLEGVR